MGEESDQAGRHERPVVVRRGTLHLAKLLPPLDPACPLDAMATTKDHKFGSLIFCERCGNLLDLPGDDDEIVCEGCGKVEDATGQSPSVSWTSGT